jgi:hypothetical protein
MIYKLPRARRGGSGGSSGRFPNVGSEPQPVVAALVCSPIHVLIEKPVITILPS